MNIKTIIKKNEFVRRLYFNLGVDKVRDYRYAMCGLEEALSTFLNPQEQENAIFVSSIIKDIKNSYWHTLATPEEYFLFGFRNIPMNERKEFVTDNYLVRTLKMGGKGFVHDDMDLTDKAAFCKRMKEYLRRPFVEVKAKSDYSEFLKLALLAKDLFFKPNFSCRGSGIFSAHVESEADAIQCFEKMMDLGGTWLVEQKIIQNKEMARWNESSVNSIRYYSFLDNKGNYSVIPHAFRTGRKGSVVDNTCSGGVFATVDPESGVVITDGIDKKGQYYYKHPDSGLVYKGWQVPRWGELCSIVKEAHKKCLPNHHFIGWDWALTDAGWVMIEANWGQVIPQHSLKRGFKKEFLINIGKLHY